MMMGLVSNMFHFITKSDIHKKFIQMELFAKDAET